MAEIPKSVLADSGGHGLSPDESLRMSSMMGTATGEAGRTPGGSFVNSITGVPFSELIPGGEQAMQSYTSHLPGWMRAASTEVGGGWHVGSLSEQTVQGLDTAAEGISQNFDQRSQRFQGSYAMQQQLREMNAFLKAAYDSGNAELWDKAAKKFAIALGGDAMKGKSWSMNAFADKGYDISALIAEDSDAKGFADRRRRAMNNGMTPTGSGSSGIQAELTRQPYMKQINAASGYLGGIFDVGSTSRAGKGMAASLALPSSIPLQERAVTATIEGASKAGLSLSELAVQAAKASRNVDVTGDAFARLQRTQQRAEQMVGFQQAFEGQTSGQIQIQRFKQAKAMYDLPASTPEALAQRDASMQEMTQEANAARERMRARLQVQRQYEIQVARSTEDFHRTQRWAEADYNIQVDRTNQAARSSATRARHQYNVGIERMNEDYNRSIFRSNRDFDTAEARSKHDFYIAQTRQQRDYHINTGRAVEDFQRCRFRQERDFGIQLARQIEDNAASLYDPYSRIQAKPTWDAANLGVNLRRAEPALPQKRNLDTLRRQGLTSAGHRRARARLDRERPPAAEPHRGLQPGDDPAAERPRQAPRGPLAGADDG